MSEERIVSLMMAEFAKVHERLESMEQRLNERLDRVEERLDKVELRLDNVERRLDKVETHLTIIDLKLGKLKDDMEGFQLNTGVNLRLIRSDIHALKDVTETVVQILKMNDMIAG